MMCTGVSAKRPLGMPGELGFSLCSIALNLQVRARARGASHIVENSLSPEIMLPNPLSNSLQGRIQHVPLQH